MSFNKIQGSSSATNNVEINGENSPVKGNSPPENEGVEVRTTRADSRIIDTAQPVKVTGIQLSAIFKQLGKK